MDPFRLLVALHVLADLVWIGSILAVGVLLGAEAPGTPADRGALAHRVYRRLAAPAFGLAFLLGVALLGLRWQHFMVLTHWMHAKLPLALAVIGLHHVLGARARRAASGEAVQGVGILSLALLGCAALATVLAVLKPF